MARETLKASEMIRILQDSIKFYGDRPVFFTDGFHRYGANCYAESAANFDSPKAMLIAAFDLETGTDGPRRPLEM